MQRSQGEHLQLVVAQNADVELAAFDVLLDDRVGVVTDSEGLGLVTEGAERAEDVEFRPPVRDLVIGGSLDRIRGNELFVTEKDDTRFPAHLMSSYRPR